MKATNRRQLEAVERAPGSAVRFGQWRITSTPVGETHSDVLIEFAGKPCDVGAHAELAQFQPYFGSGGRAESMANELRDQLIDVLQHLGR